MYRGSGVRHRRLPVVAAFFFSCAAINGSVAYLLWGERGQQTKAWVANTFNLNESTADANAPTSTKSD
eukprot:m.208411 g.208411  ORF g.208411 m.208411 type:complete len:68 (+) comp24130_c0_seq1:188-391(+)